MSEPADQLPAYSRWIDSSHPAVDPALLRERAASAAPGVAPLDLEAFPLDERPPDGSVGIRRRPLLAAAGVVLLIGLLAGTAAISHRDEPVVTASIEPRSQSLGWTTVPDLVFTGADEGLDVHALWTGHEVLLVGQLISALPSTSAPTPDPLANIPTLAGIPAFNPSTQRWRLVPAPPGDLDASGFAAAWTGTRLVVLGATRTSSGPEAHAIGASWDPTTDVWTPIAPAPAGRGLGGPAAWTGDRILTWSLGVGVTAYDPARDAWQILTTEHAAPGAATAAGNVPPPMNSAGASAVWTGTELVIADAGSSAVAAFDPAARSWLTLPPRPASSGTGDLVWNGHLLGVGDVRGPAWMAPDATSWQQSAGPASAAARMPMAEVWLTDGFLAWGGGASPVGPGSSLPSAPPDGVALTLADQRWTTFTGPPAGDIAFTHGLAIDDAVFTWGVDNDYRHTAGHGTIRAAIADAASVTAPASAGTTIPADAPLRPPAGVTAGDLGHGYGFSTVDPTWQFGAYRRSDQNEQVLTKRAAFAAARAGAPDFLAGGTEVDEAQLGHLLEQTATGVNDTLAWRLEFAGLPGPSQIEGPICTPPTQRCTPPPGSTIGDVTVVVDAHSGAVLLLQHIGPAQG